MPVRYDIASGRPIIPVRWNEVSEVNLGSIKKPNKDIIEIKHDGVVVRKITDPQTLKYFADKKMNVVINNHLQSDPPNKENYSDFVVKYFKYEKA
jgi:hypothetical protein